MKVWEYMVLIVAPVLGGVAALSLKRSSKENYKLVLSFSGAFLFSITLVHLFPVIFTNNELAGVYVLAGFFIQIFLEQLTHGIEHGHFHEHRENPSYIFALLLGLSVHSFMDGLPLANREILEESHHSLLYAISVHKIPEGFALASVLLFSNYRKTTTLLFVFVFSLVAPFAILLSNQFSRLDDQVFSMIIAMAVGSFLHVSTTIMFESESSQHFFGWKKIMAILLGAGISVLTI